MISDHSRWQSTKIPADGTVGNPDQNRDSVPHRRLNPLTGDWVLVSPHRTLRPWLGQQESKAEKNSPKYDPHCHLCPGNTRTSGDRNPPYEGPFVFTNDFSAMLPNPANDDPSTMIDGLFLSENVSGTCRVICFSSQHDKTLPELSTAEIHQVIDVWAAQTEELGRTYQWVQIFENKGAVMGCSNPHPHGQIWASSFIPNEPSKEDLRQKQYFLRNNHPLLTHYLEKELRLKQRVVVESDHWAAVVPYWAVWPFEVLLLPKAHVQRINEVSMEHRRDLAAILKRLLGAYDNLFQTSFPYSMGWHGAPFNGEDNSHWQLHAHFYPPLLRSATVKKFMVGFELLAETQRDLTPEAAAKRLREVLPSL